MKLSFVIVLFTLSSAAFALPLISVKDQLREDLWNSGLQKHGQSKKMQLTHNKVRPRLNEEVQRALIKYQL